MARGGLGSDIKAWTMDDLKNHFRLGYAPNNRTVVIVGDVQTDEVLKLAKEYFEKMPAPRSRLRTSGLWSRPKSVRDE